MQLNQVLVVYKQVTDNKPHLAVLNELYETLKSRGIAFKMVSSKHLRDVGMVDLVITVGGDGTVLTASHFAHDAPILGIKSFGKKSVGYFCAATRKTMNGYLNDIIDGRKRPIKLHRLQVGIDGEKIDELALNDVLFAHETPASTSRYKLTLGSRTEDQKSSGVWISTAAGSTAAIKSAGGDVLPLTSEKMEYFVREPYTSGGSYRLLKGTIFPKTVIKIRSLMRGGTIFIDGGSTQYPAPTGSRLTIKGAGRPLMVYWK